MEWNGVWVVGQSPPGASQAPQGHGGGRGCQLGGRCPPESALILDAAKEG